VATISPEVTPISEFMMKCLVGVRWWW